MHYRRDSSLELLIKQYCERGQPHERLSNFEVAGMFARPNNTLENAQGNEVHAKSACLNVRGRPAIAYAKRNSARDVAQGAPDAVIVVDEWRWDRLTEAERKAVIDHELTHLDTKNQKIVIRHHDFEVGWFESVASRHGESSQERIQARALLATPAAQLYFPGFEPDGETFSGAHDAALSRAVVRVVTGQTSLAEESGAIPRRRRPKFTEANHGESV